MSLHQKTVERDASGILVIRLQMNFRRRGGRKEVILPQGVQSPEDTASSLQLAIARAFCWQRMLDSGEVESISALAERVGVDKSYISKRLRAVLLAPDIVEAVMNGHPPEKLTYEWLYNSFPVMWEEQRQSLGIKS